MDLDTTIKGFPLDKETVASIINAIINTSKKRETLKYIEEANNYIELIEDDSKLKSLWKSYQSNYEYAKEISFEDTIKAIKDIKHILNRELIEV